MRKQTAFVLIVLLFVNLATAFADEAVLIDFEMLAANFSTDDDEAFEENKETIMNFKVGVNDTDADKMAKTVSLAVSNWEVELASSSATLFNNRYSLTKEVKLTDKERAAEMKNKVVLGIRVHFPVEPFNSWAKIKPPFEIPAYQEYPEDAEVPEGAVGSQFEGVEKDGVKYAYGIVKNVGIIKEVGVMVKGLNFPHGLSVILEDADGNEQIVFLGYLNFDGWKQLKWLNPQYIEDVRKRELKVTPLYPNATPFVKFKGFLITRDAAHQGGDFICYIKEVRITYEKAVTDINDIEFNEDVWGIIGQREEHIQKVEAERFGEIQILRYLEQEKLESMGEMTNPLNTGTTE
jgi:hypothetical protein